MTGTAVTADSEKFHGRNRISSRAIRAVVSAITATELGTPAKAVGVELGDDKGGLAVTISAPVRITSLAAIASGARGARHRSGATIIDRASAAQNIIRDKVLELTGSNIGTVNLRLTSAHIEEDERVL